jgi:DNA polymerase IV
VITAASPYPRREERDANVQGAQGLPRRGRRLSSPAVLPHRLFDLARALLIDEATDAVLPLVGIGAHPLVAGSTADQRDLAGSTTPKQAAAHAAIDVLLRRFGEAAITRGRSLR